MDLQARSRERVRFSELCFCAINGPIWIFSKTRVLLSSGDQYILLLVMKIFKQDLNYLPGLLGYFMFTEQSANFICVSC